MRAASAYAAGVPGRLPRALCQGAQREFDAHRGRVEVWAERATLPCNTYDRLAEVDQGAIVDNFPARPLPTLALVCGEMIRRTKMQMKTLASLTIGVLGAVSATFGQNAVVISNGNTTTVSGNSVVVVNGQVISGAPAEEQGPVAHETRSVPAFDAIGMDMPGETEYRYASSSRVTITAPALVLPKIVTKVSGGTLRIGVENGLTTNGPLQFVVEGPSVLAMSVNGVATIHAAEIRGDAVELSVKGNGRIHIDGGTVESLNVRISGAGEVNAEAVQAKVLRAGITGVGTIRAFASAEADISVSGAGTVDVAGAPLRRRVTQTGVGAITFR